MQLIIGEAKTQISEFLNKMINPVNIKLFTDNSEASNVTLQLLFELKEINNKINVEAFNLNDNKEEALSYGITGAPSFTILNSFNDQTGVLYNGIPLGHEINSLLVGILNVSGFPLGLDLATINSIKNIDKEVIIKVFVTRTCPYCSSAVITAHKIALLNPKIKAVMIEAGTFSEEATKYDVTSVPKIIINETTSFLGDQPISEFLEAINKSSTL